LEIPEGYWGIYKDKENMPLERFDPFRTIINEFGTKVGHITQFSPLRGSRPFEHQQSDDETEKIASPPTDSFCKVINGELPAIVITKQDEEGDHPFSTSPAKGNLHDSTAISIVNLFTPMARVLFEHTQKTSIEALQDRSVGIGLVHLPTNHYDTLSEAPIDEVYSLLRTTQLAHKRSIEALKERYNKDQLTTLHFFNIGEEAGASICHLHSQTYIYANNIGHGWTSLGFLSVPEFHKKAMKDEKYCLACAIAKSRKNVKDPIGQELLVEERIVYENEGWFVFTAFSPERDGQIRLIPKKHTSRFIELDDGQLRTLADVLVKANIALDEFIKSAPPNMHLLQDRNILIRQENEGYDSGMHMLIDIISIQRIGGAEKMETYRIATMFPEATAQVMRQSLIDKGIIPKS
jgi:galactose-1-phosphate uridylyltransferase